MEPALITIEPGLLYLGAACVFLIGLFVGILAVYFLMKSLGELMEERP